MADNIIITGIPRSGTTLLTALIDGMPDSVALNEPRWQYDWASQNNQTSQAEDFARWLVGDFQLARKKLINGVPIPERRMTDGSAVTNYYRPDPEKKHVGQTFSVIPFTRAGLTPDFTLAMKHNGLYIGALREIAETGAFKIIAIIRHPVGVISSWNNVPIPVGQGRMPGAVVFWHKMNEITSAPTEMLEKQVRMYDLVCQRLYNHRHLITIIRYEELIDNPGMIAGVIGKQPVIPEGMIKKRDPSFYASDTKSIEDMCRKVGQYYKMFYPF